MPRRLGKGLWFGLATVALSTFLNLPSNALAGNPYLEVLAEHETASGPAFLAANATDEQVRAWLVERSIPFRELDEPVPGIRLPGRLTGPLHGVHIHGTQYQKDTFTTPYELLDGRLALVLDEFAKLLARHQIVEAVHYTMFRPSPKAVTGEGLTRHAGGLAIDLALLRRADGTWLSVEKDWSPRLGAKTCGPSARRLDNPRGQELLELVCAAREARLFHYALTPHFDRPHATHVHLEIKPGVKWLIYH